MQIRGITRKAHDSKLRSAYDVQPSPDNAGGPRQASALHDSKGVGVINKATHIRAARNKSPLTFTPLAADEISSFIKRGFRVQQLSTGLRVLGH